MPVACCLNQEQKLAGLLCIYIFGNVGNRRLEKGERGRDVEYRVVAGRNPKT